MSRGILSRSLASGLCTALLFGTLGSLLVLIGVRAGAELSAAAQRMPELFADIALTLERLEIIVRDAVEGLPEVLSGRLTALLDDIPALLTGLPAWLSGRLLGLVSAVAERTPAALLFVITTGIGVYFVSASYPAILRFIRLQIPERQVELVRFLRTDFLNTVACWLRAQLILMAITFAELLIALTLLGAEYALAASLAIAVIDALPVFGTGTVLIPWAAISLVSGEGSFALGLILTYAAITLLRNLFQAKLLGDSLGLHPLVTLIAIYLGYCTTGIWGMILFPVLAIMIKQLNDEGYIHLWRTNEEEN